MKLHPNTLIYKTADELVASDPRYDYILLNPKLKTYEVIGSDEALVWKLLKQNKTIDHIKYILSEKNDKLEDQRIDNLVYHWQKLGIIVSSKYHHAKTLLQKLQWLELSFSQVQTAAQFLYDIIGKYIFTREGILSIFALIALGLPLALDIVVKIPENSSTIWQLLLISFVSLIFHEMAHALAMVWARADILRAGFALYFGLPVFFVDTSAVWAKKKYKRIAVSLAGPIANFLIASTLGILVFAGALPAKVVVEIILLNIIIGAFSLIPFLKMDGYFVLIDLLGIPKLSSKANSQVHDLLQHRSRLNTQSLLFLLYAGLSLTATAGVLVYAGVYWGRILGVA